MLSINLILTWSEYCFVIDDLVNYQNPAFPLTDTKLCVPVVTLSTLYVTFIYSCIKIMQKYYNNWNQVLKEQLTRINIDQI